MTLRGPQLGFFLFYGEFLIKKPRSAVFYFDGQNLYRRARAVFPAVKCPDFDPAALAASVAEKHFLEIKKIKFYTGIPPKKRDPHWHTFWTRKLTFLGRNKSVETFSRPTRLRKNTILIDGKPHETEFEVEKGIDTRIAIDIVRDVLDQESEAVVIFSQDQDLSEAVSEFKKIGKKQNRRILFFSAFPYPASSLPLYKQGIHGTDWIKISEADYNCCIDPRDYRPPFPPTQKPSSEV